MLKVVIVGIIILTLGEVKARNSQRKLSNDVCRSVFETAERLNKADRSMIFRCRPGDDGGGVGDRLGGVIGGAFYSLLHERTYRILWPGLEHVFATGATNWTFDAMALSIPYIAKSGVEIDSSRVKAKEGGEILDDAAGDGIGLVNDLNARQITNATLIPQIEKYKHIYFHSNRGPNEDMYREASAKHNWVAKSGNVDESYMAVFLCVFEAMFRPAESFLKSPYKTIGRDVMPFSHAVRIAEDSAFTSVAFHHRVDDSIAQNNGDGDLISDAAIARIIQITAKHSDPSKKAILFFITNSNASARKVMESGSLKAAFRDVYCQELTATIHVNEATRRGSNHAMIQSTQQAFRDWWLMRLVDVLIGGQSGFSKSAALFASAEQIRYEDEGNAYRPNYWTMCGSRFC